MWKTFSRNCWSVSTKSFLSSRRESVCIQIPLNLWYFAKTSDISQFEHLVCSLVFNENCSRFIKESHSSVGDNRPLPVPHSTGATVSSSPQHCGSTPPPTNDISSMSTDPTVTDTDSSLEAAAANTSLGYCRWLSFPRLSGPVLAPPPTHPGPRKDQTWHWLLPLQHFPLSTSHPCVSSVV